MAFSRLETLLEGNSGVWAPAQAPRAAACLEKKGGTKNEKKVSGLKNAFLSKKKSTLVNILENNLSKTCRVLKMKVARRMQIL